jgi:hypothetical protein
MHSEHGGGEVLDRELFDKAELAKVIKRGLIDYDHSTVPDLLADLENATGCRWHSNTYSRVINGDQLPSLSFMVALMVTIGIRVEELLPAIQNERVRKAFAKLI